MPKYVPRAAYDAFMLAARQYARMSASTVGSTRISRHVKPSDTLLNGIRSGNFGVDHRGSLARQWNAMGHTSSAEVRARFASDPNNLVAVSASWNSSKGGEGENY